jgi:DNA-binding NarL/FixJ family response regulator
MTEKADTEGIRVMHVEDHADFRDLIRILLDSQSDIDLVAQAGSLGEARHQAARSEIDVAVLDLGLPDLRQSNPDIAVLILSANLDPAGPERAPGAGADEILDKLAPVEEVVASVRKLGARNPEN